jgi:photosystem II stability/assembly factor-like uncharacterized protein
LGGRIFVLDADHAWAFDTEAFSSDLALWATVDGGAHWRRTGTVPNGSLCQMFFLDTSHGWCGSGESTMNSEPFEVLSTSDGGATWSLISRTEGLTGGGPPATPDAVPVGCAKDGPVFQTQRVGWIGSYCVGGTPWLYGTVDGGRSWHDRSGPVPDEVTRQQGMSAGPPVFEGRRGAFVITVGNGEVVVFEVTGDGGKSWTPSVFKAAKNKTWHVDVLDPEHWRMTDGEILLSTDDAGRNWSRIRPNVPLQSRGVGRYVGELHFATPTVGWVVIGGSDLEALGRTTDGGATWNPVEIPGARTSWPPGAGREAPH